VKIRFQADADLNQKIVAGIRHHSRTLPGSTPDTIQPGRDPHPANLDIGTAIEEIVLIWAASDPDEWRDHIAHLPL
jgi:hypothetical protein